MQIHCKFYLILFIFIVVFEPECDFINFLNQYHLHFIMDTIKIKFESVDLNFHDCTLVVLCLAFTVRVLISQEAASYIPLRESQSYLKAVEEKRRPVGRLVVQLVVEAQVVVVGERRALRGFGQVDLAWAS